MLKVGLSSIKFIEAIVQENSDYISLSQGAIRVGGVASDIKENLREVLRTDKTDYYQSAWGIRPLRDKIAKKLSIENNVKISSSNVLVTHGCMGAISTALLTLLERGDEVILPEPTYPAYKNIVSVARCKSVFISMPYGIDVDEIKKKVTSKTKVIIFSNPCNPVGYITSYDVLKELVSFCEEKGIYLIVDESYDNYVFEGHIDSATKFVPDSNFVIRVGSYSKTFSMSGWRVGFMVVPESLSNFMGTTQDAVLNCPNVIAQYAVLYALDSEKNMKELNRVVRRGRDVAVEMLKELVDENILSFNIPSSSFYLFMKTNESDATELCKSILSNAKVGLIPGKAFGPTGAPFIRLCYARNEDVIIEGISRLKKFFMVGKN